MRGQTNWHLTSVLSVEGEEAEGVQTGNMLYKFNRAHGLHAKGHRQGGTCRCLGSKPVPWINEFSLSPTG